MGYNITTYIGPYVKVYLPVVDSTENIMTCSKKDCNSHGKRAGSSKFCDRCGTEIKLVPITQKKSLNIYQAMENHINENMFFVVTQEWIGSNNEIDFVLFLPKCHGQGGNNIDEHEYGEYTFPDPHYNYFDHSDWIKLTDFLTELKLRFVKKVAIVKYYH